MKVIVVAAAVIEYQGKLMAFQRGPNKLDYLAHKFEFPGGKIEQGENHVETLERELLEELHMNVEIDPNEYIEAIYHTYPDFKLEMHCFLVRPKEFDVTLTEHTKYAHVNLSDAAKLDWLEADKPVLATLARYTNVFTDNKTVDKS